MDSVTTILAERLEIQDKPSILFVDLPIRKGNLAMSILMKQGLITGVLFWAFIASACAPAATAPATAPASSPVVEIPYLYPVKVSGKVGYIDRAGRMVIAAQYDSGDPFAEGRAWVNVGKETILIDESGRVILRSSFTVAWPFSEGLAGVGSDVKREEMPGPPGGVPVPSGHWGYVDRNGQWAIPAKFSFAASFHHGVATVTLGEGKPGGSSWVGLKHALIDSAGHYLIQPTDLFLVGELNDGLLPAGVGANEVSHGFPTSWGYVDKTGKWVIQPQFSQARSFSEGLAAVQVAHTAGDVTAKLWGYIDAKGKMAITPKYNSAGEFSEGLASTAIWSQTSNQVGYIDRDGKMLFKLTGLDGLPFHHGFAAVLQMPTPQEIARMTSDLDGRPIPLRNFPEYKSILIDRNGRQAVAGSYNVIGVIPGDVIRIVDHDHVEYRTLDGRTIWPPDHASTTAASTKPGGAKRGRG